LHDAAPSIDSPPRAKTLLEQDSSSPALSKNNSRANSADYGEVLAMLGGDSKKLRDVDSPGKAPTPPTPAEEMDVAIDVVERMTDPMHNAAPPLSPHPTPGDLEEPWKGPDALPSLRQAAANDLVDICTRVVEPTAAGDGRSPVAIVQLDRRRKTHLGCEEMCCIEICSRRIAVEDQESKIERLTQELFRLHDLNDNGVLEESELIRLNETLTLLHHGAGERADACEAKYRRLFREKFDPDGRPVPYETFRTYIRELLPELDKHLEAQEMILEQFIAEARMARTVVHSGSRPSRPPSDDRLSSRTSSSGGGLPMLRFYEGCYSSFCAADEGQDELVVEASMDVSSLDHPVSSLDRGVMGRGV
jgi:hypothetical protein